MVKNLADFIPIFCRQPEWTDYIYPCVHGDGSTGRVPLSTHYTGGLQCRYAAKGYEYHFWAGKIIYHSLLLQAIPWYLVCWWTHSCSTSSSFLLSSLTWESKPCLWRKNSKYVVYSCIDLHCIYTYYVVSTRMQRWVSFVLRAVNSVTLWLWYLAHIGAYIFVDNAKIVVACTHTGQRAANYDGMKHLRDLHFQYVYTYTHPSGMSQVIYVCTYY